MEPLTPEQDYTVAALTGCARARGEWWAERVAKARPLQRAWWPWELAGDTALAKVNDIGPDHPVARERLARECWAYAARRWVQLGGKA